MRGQSIHFKDTQKFLVDPFEQGLGDSNHVLLFDYLYRLVSLSHELDLGVEVVMAEILQDRYAVKKQLYAFKKVLLTLCVIEFYRSWFYSVDNIHRDEIQFVKALITHHQEPSDFTDKTIMNTWGKGWFWLIKTQNVREVFDLLLKYKHEQFPQKWVERIHLHLEKLNVDHLIRSSESMGLKSNLHHPYSSN